MQTRNIELPAPSLAGVCSPACLPRLPSAAGGRAGAARHPARSRLGRRVPPQAARAHGGRAGNAHRTPRPPTLPCQPHARSSALETVRMLPLCTPIYRETHSETTHHHDHRKQVRMLTARACSARRCAFLCLQVGCGYSPSLPPSTHPHTDTTTHTHTHHHHARLAPPCSTPARAPATTGPMPPRRAAPGTSLAGRRPRARPTPTQSQGRAGSAGAVAAVLSEQQQLNRQGTLPL